MSYEIRDIQDQNVDAFRQAIASGFGDDVDLDDEKGRERFNTVFDRDRMYPVYDGEAIVGTGGDFELTVTVPGGAQVPMSGLTIITVRPTHTRQGILTAMMRRHIDRARERGEPLGGLWASEVPIYGRFGYGPAVKIRGVKFDARHAGRGYSEPGVTVRLIEPDEAAAVIPDLFAAVQADRPGVFQRSEDWWKWRLFYDPQKHREGQSAIRHALAESEGVPVGYMTYRQKSSWDQLAEGEVRIREAIATTDAGYRALWHYASNVDLFPIVKYWNLPVDDPLHLLLHDGRALTTTNHSDSLWIRLVDIPEALARRTYATRGSVTLDVADGFAEWNAGTWRLTISDAEVSCVRTNDEADVSLDVSALGALYLGGQDARALARAGRITGTAASIELLHHMFRNTIEPWCAEVF